jgi:hypothetical protein
MLKFIAWLGGAGAGLGLLTAAVGYLALGAYDDAIGIPVLLEEKLHYVTVGGLFFARSITFILAALIVSWHSWLALLVLGNLLAALLSDRHLKPRLAIPLSFAGVAGLLIGLLFAVIWLSLVLDQDAFPGDERINQYGVIALFVTGLFAIVGSQEGLVRGGATLKAVALYRWVRIPVLALSLICAFLLPRAYGTMTLDRSFPEVLELHLEHKPVDASGAPNRPLLLLRKTLIRRCFFEE